ncbi:hypothetical protein DNTS_030128 [Danionella cerebrum]|uniref:Uncharacterized protein n=1 Tax=Danionella cerebrum TaxID=2873325 RepID=A0A553QMU7_9TELE|nr:hypothetical protein DNTS_030128 [Danionella translucida]
MTMLVSEGKASVQRNQERISHIRELKEELQREELRLTEKTNQSGDMSLIEIIQIKQKKGANVSNCSFCKKSDSQKDYKSLVERRSRLRETHERLMEDEMMKMEKDLQEEQMEGVEGELSYHRRERQVLLLQMEALRRENQQADEEMQQQHQQHMLQMNQLREQSIKVFRAFRDSLEEQRRKSESRYRSLLLEAIQDAVHLSSQNLQLQEEIQQLRRNLSLTQ